MRLLRYISILIVMFAIQSAYSQTWTGQAFEFYKTKDYDKARVAIDSAISTQERFDSQTWQLRGIIYRNITGENQLYNREIALESFVTARKIDTAGLYTEKINGYLHNTIIRYFNDAVTLLLNEGEFEKAEESYNQYKLQTQVLLDPNFNFTSYDIDFYNGMGAEYLKKVDVVEQDKKNPLRYKAQFYCEKVLEDDSLNFKANFNIGIVYYNIGADLIMNSPIDISLEDLIMNQKKSEDAFLKALPYLHKAESIEPNNKEVQEALMGCYYGLNNNEMYLKYQTLVDKHNIENYKERLISHPEDKENIRQLIRVYTYTLIDEAEAARLKQILYELQNK